VSYFVLLLCPLAPVEPTCVKQRAQFAQNKLNLEPQFEDGSCEFLPKQCDAKKCYCVSAKNGKRAFKNQEVPLGDDYDCKSEAIINALTIRFIPNDKV
jgi:hypothetical protein